MFYVDSANPEEIAWAFNLGLVVGVTTNPILLSKVEGKDRADKIRKVCDAVPLTIQRPHFVSGQFRSSDDDAHYPISVQLESQTPALMINEAHRLLSGPSADKRIVIKVPMTEHGLEVTKELSREGVTVNVTACMSFVQAYSAAMAGASYVSLLCGRIADSSSSSSEAIKQTVQRLRHDARGARVIAASLRDPAAVSRALAAGAHVATVPPGTLRKMLCHAATDKMLAEFREALPAG